MRRRLRQACGGVVIKCLTDKQENVTNEDCRKELFGVEKLQGKDWRNDAVLREACQEDVNQYCAEVEVSEKQRRGLFPCVCRPSRSRAVAAATKRLAGPRLRQVPETRRVSTVGSSRSELGRVFR